jgi:lantibiotic modifying enzyme
LKEDAAFETYLAQVGLTSQQLALVLAGGPWAPRPGADAWWDDADTSDTTRDTDVEHDRSGRLPGDRPVVIENTSFDRIPFAGLLLDRVHRHDRRLSDRLQDLERVHGAGVRLPDEIRADLLASLAGRLGQVAIRCLLAELHRRRQENELAGASCEEQYTDFDRSLRSPARRADFFARYPCLARDLATIGGQWEACVLRLLGRLAADRDELVTVGLLAPGATTLVAVTLGAGDPHGHGEAVAVLTFADGRRLVYKPRDTRIYDFYRRVVEELRPGLPSDVVLCAPRVLARSGYGWVEFIEPVTEPLSPPQLLRYLRSFGAAAGVAHVLGGCDLHLENVIATSEGPVPVDLETVVQNRSGARHTSATARAVQLLNSSVLGSGYLPVRIGEKQQGSVDVSVLTGGLVGDRHGEVLRVVDAFTAQMRIEYVRQEVGRARNQPPGMTLDLVRDNAEAVATGFNELCRAAITRKDAMLRVVAES